MDCRPSHCCVPAQCRHDGASMEPARKRMRYDEEQQAAADVFPVFNMMCSEHAGMQQRRGSCAHFLADDDNVCLELPCCQPSRCASLAKSCRYDAPQADAPEVQRTPSTPLSRAASRTLRISDLAPGSVIGIGGESFVMPGPVAQEANEEAQQESKDADDAAHEEADEAANSRSGYQQRQDDCCPPVGCPPCCPVGPPVTAGCSLPAPCCCDASNQNQQQGFRSLFLDAFRNGPQQHGLASRYLGHHQPRARHGQHGRVGHFAGHLGHH